MTVLASALQVKKLHPNAKLPTKGSEFAAGYDMYACLDEPIVIKARSRSVVPLQIAVTIPEGFYGRIAPRSGLAVKAGLDVGAGVVDRDYTGPVGAVMFNHSDSDFTVSHGDRICQMIITPYATVEVEEVDQLDNTTRGSGGFGSTGGFTHA